MAGRRARPRIRSSSSSFPGGVGLDAPIAFLGDPAVVEDAFPFVFEEASEDLPERAEKVEKAEVVLELEERSLVTSEVPERDEATEEGGEGTTTRARVMGKACRSSAMRTRRRSTRSLSTLSQSLS